MLNHRSTNSKWLALYLLCRIYEVVTNIAKHLFGTLFIPSLIARDRVLINVHSFIAAIIDRAGNTSADWNVCIFKLKILLRYHFNFMFQVTPDRVCHLFLKFYTAKGTILSAQQSRRLNEGFCSLLCFVN